MLNIFKSFRKCVAMIPYWWAAVNSLSTYWLAPGAPLGPHVDHTPSLLVGRDPSEQDPIWNKDSWGNDRLLCNIHTLDDHDDNAVVVDTIPTWLTAVAPENGAIAPAPIANEFVTLYDRISIGSFTSACVLFNIDNHPTWQALYYVEVDTRNRLISDLSAMEILRQHGVDNLPRVIYFSRPNDVPGGPFLNQYPVNALYVIREKRRIDYLPEYHEGLPQSCFSVLQGVMKYDSWYGPLTFAVKSEIAKGVVERAMLLRNHWIVISGVELHFSQTQILVENRHIDVFPATTGYEKIPTHNRSWYRWDRFEMHKLITAVAFVLHGDIYGNGRIMEGTDINWFSKSAFFVDGSTDEKSYSFNPSVNFRFKSLREVIGNDPDLVKIDSRILAKGFSRYSEHLEEHLFSANEYQPGSIKSIREFLLNYAIVV